MEIVHIPIKHMEENISCYPNFIEGYSGYFINIGISTSCGVYESQNRWWIWFKIRGQTEYYYNPFDTKEEAEDYIRKIIYAVNELRKENGPFSPEIIYKPRGMNGPHQ